MRFVSTTHDNIKAISAMEKEVLAQRSFSAKLGDSIASHAGKMWFIGLHAVWFTGWILLNNKTFSPLVFDPFPYPFLTMVVSLEAIFLSLFILMSQNRTGLQAEHRNHLDLQINLLSEHENTKMIQMLRALCEYHQLTIAQDKEITELATRTNLLEVLEDLKHNLPVSS